MKKKIFFAGMLALVLTLGMTVIGCDDGSGGGGGIDGSNRRASTSASEWTKD